METDMENQRKEDINPFGREVAEKEKRKLNAQQEEKRSTWFGLAAVGMVGWTVAVPTLLGAALGVWLDKKYPESFSWTLSLLFIGLVIGCGMAWQWVEKENKAMSHKNKKDDD